MSVEHGPPQVPESSPRGGVNPRSHLYLEPQIARLRIALVTPLAVPAWLAAFLKTAADRDWIDVNVVLAAFEAPARVHAHLPIDVRAYLAMERRRQRHAGGGMLARVDVSEYARRHGATLSAGGDDIAQLGIDLAALAPDLILLYGGRDWAEAIAANARWGCWCIGSDLADPRSAALNLLVPLIDRKLVTAVGLRLDYRAPQRSIALAVGNGATRAGSFTLQREQALRKLPTLLLRSLRLLHEDRFAVPERSAADLRLQEDGRILTSGAGLRAFDVSLRNTLRWWRQLWHGEDPWFLGVRRERTALDPAAPEVGAVDVLVAPEGRYWADPCIVEHAGERLLFVEEYAYRGRKGVIACIALRGDGTAQRLGIALEESWHLSYPQVFIDRGDV